LYGGSPAFRDGLALTGKWYFTAIKENSLIWSTPPQVHIPPWCGHGPHPTRLRLKAARKHPVAVKDLVKKIPNQDWVRTVIKEGSKGPIVCDFAFLRVTESRSGLPADELWLILRRNRDDPSEVKSFYSNAPASIPLAELIRVCGMRWPIENIFEEAKGEVGMDHCTCTNRQVRCEMRSWIRWHHHMLLETLQTGIEKLLNKRKRLQVVYLDPDIGMRKEEYLAEKQILDDSISATQEESEKITASLQRIPTEADLVQLEEMAGKMVEALRYNLDIPEIEKHRILKLLNVKVILSPNKDITLEGWFTPTDDGLSSGVW
jgi:hypothetical protein